MSWNWKIWMLGLLPKPKRIALNHTHFQGCNKDEKDTRDFKAKAVLLPQILPKRIWLKPWTSSVKQQGIMSSCSAHAAVLVYELSRNMIAMPAPEGSELYLYYWARHYDGSFPEDGGTRGRDIMKALYKQGCCPEKLMPYDDRKPMITPPMFANDFAKFFKIKTYTRLTEINQIKQSLAENKPVWLGVPIWSSWMTVDTNIPLPHPNARAIGGHAIAIIGYDDDKQAFYIQNSWGNRWANNGFAWLPYKYFDKISWWDAWQISL